MRRREKREWQLLSLGCRRANGPNQDGAGDGAAADAPPVRPRQARRTRTRPTATTPATQARARTLQAPPRHRSPVRDRDARRPTRLRTVHETSAGGLVIDGLDGPKDDQVAALIGRTDRRGRVLWSLPKGHIELGETAEQTAIREVAEETGIQGDVLAALGSIDYWFVTEGRRVHKTVHHYLMRFLGGELVRRGRRGQRGGLGTTARPPSAVGVRRRTQARRGGRRTDRQASRGRNRVRCRRCHRPRHGDAPDALAHPQPSARRLRTTPARATGERPRPRPMRRRPAVWAAGSRVLAAVALVTLIAVPGVGPVRPQVNPGPHPSSNLSIDRVTPDVVTTTSESVVTVAGTVTNVGDRPVRDVMIRLEHAPAVDDACRTAHQPGGPGRPVRGGRRLRHPDARTGPGPEAALHVVVPGAFAGPAVVEHRRARRLPRARQRQRDARLRCARPAGRRALPAAGARRAT